MNKFSWRIECWSSLLALNIDQLDKWIKRENNTKRKIKSFLSLSLSFVQLLCKTNPTCHHHANNNFLFYWKTNSNPMSKTIIWSVVLQMPMNTRSDSLQLSSLFSKKKISNHNLFIRLFKWDIAIELLTLHICHSLSSNGKTLTDLDFLFNQRCMPEDLFSSHVCL